ncbi:O-methyltransferase [Oceanobacillus sp. Castelsardo]|uniref:O-methyltransferase n=1 Tax=Oceanobacillus sp. Castelsardo TaxID=1851204 RepID=UPI0008399D8B|nr:O-methyltransferase [Oceanobacillus sp. Castelsardo]
MDDLINNYLLHILPEKETWIKEIEEQAKIDSIPIMDQVSMHFVTQIIQIKKPKRILEIGTAIGYSALRMHDACPKSQIVTIERDDVRYKQAIQNIKHLNKEKNIDVIFGDALEKLEELMDKEEKFDLIFIDAAKGQYQRFFELSLPLLNSDGLIITDNVLFRGYVANPEVSPKRYEKMVEKIIKYNDFLMNQPEFNTSIIPIGDGVALSSYK